MTLTDAETGADPNNPAVRAFFATGNSLGAGLANTGDTPAVATGNFWVGGVTTSGTSTPRTR